MNASDFPSFIYIPIFLTNPLPLNASSSAVTH